MVSDISQGDLHLATQRIRAALRRGGGRRELLRRQADPGVPRQIEGRGTSKQPVFGILERNGRVCTEIIPDCKKSTLQAIIKGKVSPDTAIYSDGWRGDHGLVDVGYDKHFRVNHSQNEFSRGQGVHVNGIENFWSFTKRRLAKFNGVKCHFNLHLKESEWRYGREKEDLAPELWRILKWYYKPSVC